MHTCAELTNSDFAEINIPSTLQTIMECVSKWINENYSEVNVRVVNLFVSLCQIHQEQKTITSHVKMVTKPLQSPEFLSLIEIDLMDFRNTPCDCKNVHTWAMNIIDHHTKFVTVVPLQQKQLMKYSKASESTVTPTDFQRK